MGKLSEIRKYIHLAEEKGDEMTRDCFQALLLLRTAEIINDELYDSVFFRIKERLEDA